MFPVSFLHLGCLLRAGAETQALWDCRQTAALYIQSGQQVENTSENKEIIKNNFCISDWSKTTGEPRLCEINTNTKTLLHKKSPYSPAE